MSSPPNPFGPGASTGGPGDSSPFGSSSSFPAGLPGSVSPAPLTPVGPPTVLLWTAGAIAVVGIVIGALGWGHWLSVIGWALAGPVAIGVAALFSAKDTERRTAPLYLRPDSISVIYAAVMVLVAAGVIVGALGFAMWVGRL